MKYGVIQNIKEIAKIAKKHNIYFHTDSVQAIGNIKINVKEQGIDMLSLSAHKFYGPKRHRNAIYKRRSKYQKNTRPEDIKKETKEEEQKTQQKLQDFGAAINLAYKNIDAYNEKLVNLREYYFENIEKRIKDIKINGDRENRLPGNANISFKGIDRRSTTFKTRQYSEYAHQSALPVTQEKQNHHMSQQQSGVPLDFINGTLRVTFGEQNTKEDVEFLVDKLCEIISELRKQV